MSAPRRLRPMLSGMSDTTAETLAAAPGQNAETAPAEHFDLVIIGSGSGNSLITEAWEGRRVAVVDAGTFGGTCLNVGCIPTKMYAYPASLAGAEREAARVDVDLRREAVDFPALRDRIFGRIDAISEGGLRYRRDELEHTTVVQERVRFTGPKELTTDSGRVLTADQIVVAAGSRPTLLDIPGVDLPAVHTSDTVMRLPELPRRVVVIGGGFIAVEFAAVFDGLGSEVVEVIRGERLLSSHDAAISARFTQAASRTWDLRTGWQPVEILPGHDDGPVTVRFSRASSPAAAGEGSRTEEASGADEVLELEADVVLMATGRTPNVDTLDVAAAGLDVTDRGTLAVDAHQRLLSGGEPVPGLWGLGDAANAWQLKHVANHEARVVAHNLVHPEDLRENRLDPVPFAVFSRPQVATAGLTEEQAAAELGPENITVKEQEFGDVAYGWAMNDETGLCKLIADRRTGRIVGAHLVGHDAANLIQPLVQAMSFGLDAHTMARGQYWIHPALSEVVENALLGLEVPDSGLL